MIGQHKYASPPSLRDKVPTVPHAVEQTVLTALAKDPGSRFTSIQAFAEILEQTCQSSSYRTPSQRLDVFDTDPPYTLTDRDD